MTFKGFSSYFSYLIRLALSNCIKKQEEINDKTLFNCTLKKQISVLVMDTDGDGKQKAAENAHKLLFPHILTTFTNLQYLSFGSSSFWYQQLSFNISSPTVISSTLLELYVCLNTFIDCLYLLDGCFNQLCKFYVKIEFITISRLTINNKKKLPNLRSILLCSDISTDLYDELIVPLLHRMPNLEELDLSLLVCVKTIFIHGNVLKTSVINHMTRLSGLFKCVRKVELTVVNQKRQTDKQIRKSKNENKDFPIIEYLHLARLDLAGAHIDYHEQFLVDTKTCSPNNLRLSMNYQSVKKVTRN
ncbi:unnamed protein product [Rotaria socialis]|uniref:Uncharacterized protein n=2 Tax=Rotaria socialis TaxID=392032 RepID=A0A820R225_9BILA|nr:unnamed protein product [Rotaria socialis]